MRFIVIVLAIFASLAQAAEVSAQDAKAKEDAFVKVSIALGCATAEHPLSEDDGARARAHAAALQQHGYTPESYIRASTAYARVRSVSLRIERGTALCDVKSSSRSLTLRGTFTGSGVEGSIRLTRGSRTWNGYVRLKVNGRSVNLSLTGVVGGAVVLRGRTGRRQRSFGGMVRGALHASTLRGTLYITDPQGVSMVIPFEARVD